MVSFLNTIPGLTLNSTGMSHRLMLSPQTFRKLQGRSLRNIPMHRLQQKKYSLSSISTLKSLFLVFTTILQTGSINSISSSKAVSSICLNDPSQFIRVSFQNNCQMVCLTHEFFPLAQHAPSVRSCGLCIK